MRGYRGHIELYLQKGVCEGASRLNLSARHWGHEGTQEQQDNEREAYQQVLGFQFHLLEIPHDDLSFWMEFVGNEYRLMKHLNPVRNTIGAVNYSR